MILGVLNPDKILTSIACSAHLTCIL